MLRNGAVAAKAGAHLSARQAFQRDKIVAAIEHKRAAGMTAAEAVADYLRDAAFTTLNRFVALKMLEARELVQECITKGEQSAGYREFCGMAPGLALLPDSAGYRLYIECLFDELSTEVKVLFDRRDPRPCSGRSGRRSSAPRDPQRRGARTTSGARTRPSAGSTSSSTATTSARRCARRARRRATAASWPCATSSSRRATSSSSSPTTRSAASGTRCAAARRRSPSGASTWSASPTRSSRHAAKKDPRDLRVLDPACGCGHFLLYAFDLLLAIYEEA